MKLALLPPEERPRERLFARGPHALSLAELLAILLNTGAAGMDALELAGAILQRYGTVEMLARALPAELLELRGMGEAKVAHLVAAMELARRLRASRSANGMDRGWESRLAALAEEVRNDSREFIFAIYLDGREEVLGEDRVSFGGVDGASLDVAFLLRSAVRIGAEALVLAHNHPDGSAEASPEDKEMTLIVGRRLDVLGMALKGHVVLADGVVRAII